MDKQSWLDRAEVIDAVRLFPRILLGLAFLYVFWYAWFALTTIVALSREMAGLNWAAQIVQAVASGVIAYTVPMITQVFGKICDVYMNTGRKWS